MNVQRKVDDFILPDQHELDGVAARDSKGRVALYAGREKIYPKLARGYYRRLKWVLMLVTLGIYYLVPWIRYDRGPDLPNQAVMLDMTHGRFFFFGIEIWPQEFYFVTGLLILASLSLFLVTSMAGRVWCGYFCPQTVWTDLMVAVERFWQGDRSARIRLDKSPWSANKLFKKFMTHVSWIIIAAATGGAFVLYFADAPNLLPQLFDGTAPTEAYVFIAILTLTTYGLGGIAREQVCIYMCPWPRIQGAMIDKDSFLISYREWRGEPRGPFEKSNSGAAKGDCIDCKACIAVCPTNIDIRNGPQLECIQCALCVDACNDIMRRIGRPENLIGYATIAGLNEERAGTKPSFRALRPRTLLYTAMIGVVGAIMLTALLNRSTLDANLLPDRNPMFVKLSDGAIRNGYTLKVLNKLHEPRTFHILVEGIPAATVTLGGTKGAALNQVTVPTDVLSELRVYIAVPAGELSALTPQAHDFKLVVQDIANGARTVRETTFRRPG
ncbi:MAG: cytochrome c oxidase accessory protein CcoG [Hyphomicrobium sp.]